MEMILLRRIRIVVRVSWPPCGQGIADRGTSGLRRWLQKRRRRYAAEICGYGQQS
jgi:hypothetical protein